MNFKTFKTSSLVIASMFSLCSMTPSMENKELKDKKIEENRIEVNFKQRHSKPSSDLYADGIKIKRDLSLIKEAQEERVLDMDEIPSDDMYGGIWSNRYVNAYGSLDNAPSTFNIDLSNFNMPTMGYTTSKYGSRGKRMHHGIDLKVQIGDTIYAAFDGKVRVCQYEKRGYGYYVVLRHPNGLETVYGHLSGFLVSINDVVKSGQPIALGGNTGRSTGSHLHFETRFLGRSINPTSIIDFDSKSCWANNYIVNYNSLGRPGQSLSQQGYAASSTRTSSSGTNRKNKYTAGKVKYYRVQKGDTLSRIAGKYGMTVQQLCKLNSMSRRETLRPGKSLRVS